MEQGAVVAAGEHRIGLHAVEVAEDAQGHLVFFQELRKAAGLGQVADRRVVEEQDGVLAAELFCFLQGPLDAQELAAVGLGVPFFLVVDVAGADPAVSAANGDAPFVEGDCRAVEVLHVVFGVHAVELAGAFPPEVVVAADDELPSRQGPDFVQVFLGVLEVHGPRRVAGDEYRVVGGDAAVPVFLDAAPVVFPAGAEYFHRLFRRMA